METNHSDKFRGLGPPGERTRAQRGQREGEDLVIFFTPPMSAAAFFERRQHATTVISNLTHIHARCQFLHPSVE
jgi:hypothetical protein